MALLLAGAGLSSEAPTAADGATVGAPDTGEAPVTAPPAALAPDRRGHDAGRGGGRETSAADNPARPTGQAAADNPARPTGQAAADNPARPTGPSTTHTVEPGETLSDIAERHGVSTLALAAANAIRDARGLRPGTVLVLPDSATEPIARPDDARTANPGLAAILEDVSVAFGWRAETVMAIAWAESRWNQQVVSPAGAIGVMQVLPETAAKMEELLDRPLDPYDLRDNVTAGVAYLDLLYQRHNGDFRRALVDYHQGAGSAASQGELGVTRAYVAEVLRLRHRFAD